jgi:MFS family permease
VKNVLQGDVGHFSAAMGAFGVGGLLGALGLLFVDPARDRRHMTLWFAALMGLVTVLVALNPWVWALPVLLVLAGVAMIVCNTSANALLQTAALPQLRGQTISLFMLAMRGGMSLGGLVTGVTVSVLGAPYALLANGVLAMMAVVLIAQPWLRSAAPRAELTGNL